MDRASLIAAMQATANQPPTPVETKEWGTVYVRQVTVAEVDADQAAAADKDDDTNKNKIARGACRVICDENGQRIFDPTNKDDVELLASQPWELLRKLASPAGGGDAGNG